MALSDPNSKSDFFRRSAPNDSKLHRFARHSEFAGRVEEAFGSTVDIRIDDVVDTESNLTPVVVRKNLFRLGLPHDEFKVEEGTINELLRRRNDIAHGSSRTGVPMESYGRLESSVEGMMRRVVVLIFDSLRSRRFLKGAAVMPTAVSGV